MLDYIEIEQNTDEWFALRGGRLTSSKLGVIMATSKDYSVITVEKGAFYVVDNNLKKLIKKCHSSKIEAENVIYELKKKDLMKAFTSTAKKYAVEIAIEQITGEPMPSGYSNSDMQRGHEQEPIARMMYEDDTFCDVDNGGFFANEFIGCSPDGLVGHDGVIEIKSVIAVTQFATVKRQSLDPAYKWQCIGNLKFTGRDWLDYVSYCSEFPEDKQLFIHRLNKEAYQEEFNMIDARINMFKELVEQTKQIVLNNQYSI